MKRILIFVICIFSFAFAEGQTSTIKVKKQSCDTNELSVNLKKDPFKSFTFKGKVIQAFTKTPLPNVAVTCKHDNIISMITSDKNGDFIILPDGSTSFTFSVDYPFYYLSKLEFVTSDTRRATGGTVYIDLILEPCKNSPFTK